MFETKNFSHFSIGYEGDQNMPPENLPLWPKDYFELKEIEKKQTQEDISALPPSA